MRGQLVLIKCPDGKKRSLKEAYKKYGIQPNTLRGRMKRGCTTEEIFNKNLRPRKRKPAAHVPSLGRFPERTSADIQKALDAIPTPTKLDAEMHKIQEVPCGRTGTV